MSSPINMVPKLSTWDEFVSKSDSSNARSLTALQIYADWTATRGKSLPADIRRALEMGHLRVFDHPIRLEIPAHSRVELRMAE